MTKQNLSKNSKYRDPEDLTDSEEDVHPNISARSYHQFIRAEREKRLQELNAKPNLTEEEENEKELLIYKTLPVDREVGKPSFTFSKEPSNTDVDYSDHLIYLVENNEISDFIRILDDNDINLDLFEELVYYNLISAIKENKDEIGYIFCKIGLVSKWARLYGRQYLCKLKEVNELDEIFKSHYKESVNAIKKFNNIE